MQKHIPSKTAFGPLNSASIALLLLVGLGQAQWSLSTLNSGGPVSCFANFGGGFYAGTDGGGAIYRYAETGTAWTPVGTGITKTNVIAIAVIGSSIFTGNAGAVFRSSDTTASWTKLNSGLTDSLVRSLIAVGTTLYAGTDGGKVFKSVDNGNTWTASGTGLLGTRQVYALIMSGQTLLAATAGNGVFRSTDNGDTWTQAGTGNTTTNTAYSFAAEGSNLYVGTGDGVMISTDNGATWTERKTGLPSGSSVRSLLLNGADLYAGTGDGVFLSVDKGVSWAKAATGLPANYVRAMGIFGSNLFAAVSGEGLYKLAITNKNSAIAGRGARGDAFGFLNSAGSLIRPMASIAFSIPAGARVDLGVYDASGILVETLVAKVLQPGVHTAHFHGKGLPEGHYFLRLSAQGSHRASHFVLAK